MGNKSLGAASKGLFIDVNCVNQYSIIEKVSPKSNIHSGKYQDMPVKRIDNFTKEIKNDKKSQKKDQLKRKQVSQPNLTPKGHSKIENEKKVIAKNNSLLFEKKKSINNPKNVDFKKKPKSIEIAKSLQ